jgi:hypothetical protein
VIKKIAVTNAGTICVLYIERGITMRKVIYIIFLVTGCLFLINALFGRYIVLPGYFDSLETGMAQGRDLPNNVPVWKIIRYLVWAFSFKFGCYFILLAGLIRKSFGTKTVILVSVLGLLYISIAYMPLPGPISLVFGIGGGIMTICISLLFLLPEKEGGQGSKRPPAKQVAFAESKECRRQNLQIKRRLVDIDHPQRKWFSFDNESRRRLISLLKISGFFFFAMASYNLCPLLGIKTFGLYPEKMIRYGLTSEAASFATHILIELTIGWGLFLAARIIRVLGHNKEKA